MAAFFCPACWKEVPERTPICPHCGASLEERPREAFVEKLVGALRHPIGFQAATAAMTLGRLKDPRGVNSLLEVFDRTRDPEVHESAIWALGELRAAPRLVELLDDPHVFLTLRIGCTEALAKIGGDEAQAALERAARSDQRVLRRAAQTELRHPPAKARM
jgi:HEAT repeat protein